MITRLRLIAAALLLAGGLTACGATGEPGEPAPSGQDTGVGHVHGLGADPATGKVYVAGHYGLFTVERGRLVRVGDQDADFMGFTVAGPRTFYASGHPSAEDIANGAQPHLGLIRSTDAGRTWTQIALAGKADFHALEVAGEERIYGYDSQTGQVWRGDGGRLPPAARLDLLDLAAGPADPGTVYATTPEGVMISTDAGMTFRPLRGAPLLMFLEVTDDGHLIGVDTDARIRVSTDRGATWAAKGALPMPPVAFTAVSPQRLLAAAMDGSVYESTDGGASVTRIAAPTA